MGLHRSIHRCSCRISRGPNDFVGSDGLFASKPAPTGGMRSNVGVGLLAKRPGQTASMLDQFDTDISTGLLIQLQPEMLLAGNLGSGRQSISIHQSITR